MQNPKPDLPKRQDQPAPDKRTNDPNEKPDTRPTGIPVDPIQNPEPTQDPRPQQTPSP